LDRATKPAAALLLLSTASLALPAFWLAVLLIEWQDRQGGLEGLQPPRTLHNLLSQVLRNDRWDRAAADVLMVRYDAQRRKHNG
jgi:hypothetical protein